jgi:hypothetical protein
MQRFDAVTPCQHALTPRCVDTSATFALRERQAIRGDGGSGVLAGPGQG